MAEHHNRIARLYLSTTRNKMPYTVTNKTISGFTIHSYNDWTSAITQTVNAIVMHK